MPRKVTIDDMVEAVRAVGRPCTKQDIAGQAGVSRQTIANHEEELESDPRINHAKVGTATAYWLADATQPPEPPEQGQTPGDDPDGDRDDTGTTSERSEAAESDTQPGPQFAPHQWVALIVSGVLASFAVLGGIAGAFAALGVSLTRWALATPLFQIGVVAVVVAVLAFWVATRHGSPTSNEVET